MVLMNDKQEVTKLCNIKNKQINECSCIMCPAEKIEPGPKSYDLIPHPPFMYFNKIMGFHK